MFRLTDFSQTGRILKVQNTFSTRKYPIYYSYDPESMQTYLTKVVTSKDPLVIACFKTHINQNVLPYLLRRSDRNSASLLAIRPQQAEVILKIDEQAKNEKCEVINQRIKEYSNMLKYYSQYHYNSEFRKRIEVIKKFVEQFEPKEESKLGDVIKEIRELLMAFSQLLDEIDHIKIQKQQIREKIGMFKITQAEQQQEDKIQNLEKSLQQLNKGGSTKESTMKPHLVNQLKTQLQTCLRILQDRKTILNDFTYYQKGECSDKIEYIYYRYDKQREQLEYEEKMVYESNVLFLTKLQIRGMTLRQMIISKDERLTPDFCLDLVKALMDFVLLYGGIENLLLTTENIIIQECGTFHINYFSLVGLEFLKLRKYVSKADFLEILPYLTFDSLYSGDNSQVLLRFIVINFVSAFLRRDMVFDAKAIDFDFEVQVDNLQPDMRNVEERMFPKIVSAQDRKKIKDDFDTPFKVNFSVLVEKVFSAGEKITWEFLFSCVRRNNSDESRLNIQSQKPLRSTTVLDIVEDLQEGIACRMDGFYVVALSMMEVFDHFTTILDKFGEKLVQLKTGREKIGKLRRRVMEQRDFFMHRGWYTNEIFIPAKCSMTYAQILDYSNWVQMLHLQNRVNLQTIKGVQNLLSCLLDLQNTLVAIQPYLDDQLLEDSFLNHQCNYHTQLPPDGKVKSYYLLLQNYLNSKSKKQKQEREKIQSMSGEETVNVRGDREVEGLLYSSDQEESNKEKEREEASSFKGYFWKCCFATLRVVYQLIRNYYLRMHEISLNGSVSINGGKFSQWMQHFTPKTPPLTTP